MEEVSVSFHNFVVEEIVAAGLFYATPAYWDSNFGGIVTTTWQDPFRMYLGAHTVEFVKERDNEKGPV